MGYKIIFIVQKFVKKCDFVYTKHGHVKNSKQCGGFIRGETNRCSLHGDKFYCKHDRKKSRCCGGSELCQHLIVKSNCKYCDPNGYFIQLTRRKIAFDLDRKNKKYNKFLNNSGVGYRDFLQNQLDTQVVPSDRSKMSWENYGSVWEIDHIIPLRLDNDLDKIKQRFDYNNTQIMYCDLNKKKGKKLMS